MNSSGVNVKRRFVSDVLFLSNSTIDRNASCSTDSLNGSMDVEEEKRQKSKFTSKNDNTDYSKLGNKRSSLSGTLLSSDISIRSYLPLWVRRQLMKEVARGKSNSSNSSSSSYGSSNGRKKRIRKFKWMSSNKVSFLILFVFIIGFFSINVILQFMIPESIQSHSLSNVLRSALLNNKKNDSIRNISKITIKSEETLQQNSQPHPSNQQAKPTSRNGIDNWIRKRLPKNGITMVPKSDGSPVCMIRVTGPCSKKQLDYLPYYGWFNDSAMGGPTASTESACRARMLTWKKGCDQKYFSHGIEMYFNATYSTPFQGATFSSDTSNSYKPQCYIRVVGACLGLPEFSDSDWFDSDKAPFPSGTEQNNFNDGVGNNQTRRMVTSLFECRLRQQQWQELCADTTTQSSSDHLGHKNVTGTTPTVVLLDYDGFGKSASDATCKMQIVGHCAEFPSLSNSDWFDDYDKGGPKPTSYWDCKFRQNQWSLSCQTIVRMDFDGPGIASPIKRDGSWDIYDIDGAIVNILPIDSDSIDNSNSKKWSDRKKHQSCYQMKRNPPLPNVPYVHFCYPMITIAGHPKAGTSFLYHVLKEHPSVRPAYTWKEYCRKRNNGQTATYFRHFYGLAKASLLDDDRNNNYDDAILVNGCIIPDEIMELDVLLKGPRGMSVYLVRDAAERSWATYNYWCDANTEPQSCIGFGRAIPGVHARSPVLFHHEITERTLQQQNIPKKLLIPDYQEISHLYTSHIHRFETETVSKYVHVIASEEMKYNLSNVWNNLATALRNRTGYELGIHPTIHALEDTRVNQGNDVKSGEDSVEKMQYRALPLVLNGTTKLISSTQDSGLYAPSNYTPMMDETRKLLTYWWDECDELRNRTKWPYNCFKSGYKKSKEFRSRAGDVPLEDVYITLWLHQVHSWFAEDDPPGPVPNSKVRTFLQQAKDAGFTSVMADLPWAWTEREAHDDIRVDSFRKDWMGIACEMGLSLHIVISMREFPPWVNSSYSEYFEAAVPSKGRNCVGQGAQTQQPSVAHPQVWEWIQHYTRSSAKLLLDRYGSCIKSFSPTVNNEFETRFAQTFDMMRDYSTSAIKEYNEWQVSKQIVPSMKDANPPPSFDCIPYCQPIIVQSSTNWLGFREEFLANRYIDMCKIIHDSALSFATDGTKKHDVNCLLHIGEVFSTTDFLNSNLFYKLAKSQYVNELVMDSNMALHGAPSSPSIVGILISAAKAYGKIVHYEAATERILTCNEKGQLVQVSSNTGNTNGAPLLLRTGIEYALDASTDSLGITNLCAPLEMSSLFSHSADGKANKGSVSDMIPYTVSKFVPTAVIYVPYRVFFAWSFAVSGVTCLSPATECWHPSFDQLPVFGRSKLNRKAGMCSVDIAQHALIEVWDDLRTRHEQVAVIGDVDMLTDDLMTQALERVILMFPMVMNNVTWNFYEGDETFQKFREIDSVYTFHKHNVQMPK